MQGSTISPILFNTFLNDLLNSFETNNIHVLAYADDIVWWCENLKQIEQSIEVMGKWWKENRMNINPTKSGILRILNRKGKILGIKNSLSIPEVENYTYLGITITQSLKLKDHENKLRKMENFISTRVNIIARYIKNTKAKRLLYKVMLKSKWSYNIETLIEHDYKYKAKLE